MKTHMMILVAALGLAACGGKGKKDDTMNNGGGGSATVAGGKLYDRLGGKDAITAVVNEFVENGRRGHAINKRSSRSRRSRASRRSWSIRSARRPAARASTRART